MIIARGEKIMAEFHEVDQAALDLVDGWPVDQVPHADYPHEPGRLHDCLRCSVECFCTGQPGHTECVFCAILSESSNIVDGAAREVNQ